MDPKEFKQRLDELAEVIHSEETGSWVVKKIKACLRHCDRCDRTQEGDLLCNSRLVPRPIEHWRHHCKTCGCYLDPRTHQPMEGPLSTVAGQVISIQRWMKTPERARKPYKKWKVNPIKISTQTDAEEITDGAVTIRRWDRSETK